MKRTTEILFAVNSMPPKNAIWTYTPTFKLFWMIFRVFFKVRRNNRYQNSCAQYEQEISYYAM